MKTKSSLQVLFCLLVVSGIVSTAAYGHGLGGETHPPVTLEGRDVTLSVNISPSTFDPNDPERYITVDLKESKSQAVVEHVTYTFELIKDGEQIFRRMFHDDLGNLAIKVVNDDSNEIKVTGKKSPGIEAWMRTPQQPVTMTGPIFDSGGLYEYKVEILTVDKDDNFLDKRLELTGDISLAEKNTYSVMDSTQKSHQLKLISYFDKIENFEFDSNQISFSMPFDWNQDFEQISIVHQEIRIPPSFSEFLQTQYDVTVNGIVLEGKGAVTIDDYSTEGRTIHVVLNKNDLKQMKSYAIKESESEMLFELEPSKDVTLPLQANTPDLRYRASLSWMPETIVTGKDVTFFLNLDEMYTEKLKKEVEYSIKLTQNGSEIYQERVKGNVNSEYPDEFTFNFLPENSGTIKFDIYDIEGYSLSNVNFLVVINPQEDEKFPISLQSISPDGSDGSYRVDLTWFPNTLGLGESEFVMTFYDKSTGNPVQNSPYDFVLIKNNSEIHRKSGLASGGGTFENFVFVENETGEITLRIEKINGTDEFVKIPLKVTPEFPLGLSVFFVVAIVLTTVLLKTKYVNSVLLHDT